MTDNTLTENDDEELIPVDMQLLRVAKSGRMTKYRQSRLPRA